MHLILTFVKCHLNEIKQVLNLKKKIMKVLFYSSHKFELKYYQVHNLKNLTFEFSDKVLNENTVDLSKGFDAISVFSCDKVNAQVLKKLNKYNVKYITSRSAGFNHIDLEEAKNLNIKVAYVPCYSPNSVAEHTVAMMLALNRKIVKADQKVKTHDFSIDNLIGFDMVNKKVGLLGLGRIGSKLAKILNGFGCYIYGYDIEHNDDLSLHYDVSYQNLDFILRNADIISLQLPLTEDTYHIIGEKEISKMKDGVMIINTGRGGLLDTYAIIDGLKSEKIGYLGLDVYENEANLFHQDHTNDILQDDQIARLMSFQNVLITSHQGFLTNEALQNIADATIENLNKYRLGKNPTNSLI